MIRVFVDGSAGTTGLRIRERLTGRRDIELVSLPEELRKDAGARRDAISRSDVVFLCLPDDAAREAAGLADSPDTVIIDTSTAHRTSDGWEYGFPELSGRRERIASSKRTRDATPRDSSPLWSPSSERGSSEGTRDCRHTPLRDTPGEGRR